MALIQQDGDVILEENGCPEADSAFGDDKFDEVNNKHKFHCQQNQLEDPRDGDDNKIIGSEVVSKSSMFNDGTTPTCATITPSFLAKNAPMIPFGRGSRLNFLNSTATSSQDNVLLTFPSPTPRGVGIGGGGGIVNSRGDMSSNLISGSHRGSLVSNTIIGKSKLGSSSSNSTQRESLASNTNPFTLKAVEVSSPTSPPLSPQLPTPLRGHGTLTASPLASGRVICYRGARFLANYGFRPNADRSSLPAPALPKKCPDFSESLRNSTDSAGQPPSATRSFASSAGTASTPVYSHSGIHAYAVEKERCSSSSSATQSSSVKVTRASSPKYARLPLVLQRAIASKMDMPG